MKFIATVDTSGADPGYFRKRRTTHRSGFTLEGQLGATYMTLHAASATTTAQDSKVGPMLNLQIGYSF